jgi:hypothetical protein
MSIKWILERTDVASCGIIVLEQYPRSNRTGEALLISVNARHRPHPAAIRHSGIRAGRKNKRDLPPFPLPSPSPVVIGQRPLYLAIQYIHTYIPYHLIDCIPFHAIIAFIADVKAAVS